MAQLRPSGESTFSKLNAVRAMVGLPPIEDALGKLGHDDEDGGGPDD